jgi:hypothetical protein
VVAGTVGFGLWDALWMSFDHDRASRMLTDEPDFARTVFAYWHQFHLEATSAMLDAGIRLVLFREHPRGFSEPGMTTRLDDMLADHFREMTRTVHSRGGCILLDCDEDEIFETDCALQWGFDGIGPMRFRDRADLVAARRCLDGRLILAGTLADGTSYTPTVADRSLDGKLIVTNKPDFAFRTLGIEVDEPGTGSNGLRLAS